MPPPIRGGGITIIEFIWRHTVVSLEALEMIPLYFGLVKLIGQTNTVLGTYIIIVVLSFSVLYIVVLCIVL